MKSDVLGASTSGEVQVSVPVGIDLGGSFGAEATSTNESGIFYTGSIGKSVLPVSVGINVNLTKESEYNYRESVLTLHRQEELDGFLIGIE